MISFPNAKINLGLHVIARRPDGYHNISSCFYPIPWQDTLEIIPSEKFSITTHGLPISGKSEDNLCYKAYQILKEKYSIPPVEIHLLKAIPMGAGLGGGSADGSFVLTMLNEHFELGINANQLEEYALMLGSDCPFFIKNKPAIAKGVGDELKLTGLSLKGHYIALYNPNIHISTKEAYSGVVPKKTEESIEEILALPISEWKNLLVNDFETSILPKYPKVKEAKQKMYEKGAIYASMTGSGSTVYGIFKKEIIEENWKCFELD